MDRSIILILTILKDLEENFKILYSNISFLYQDNTRIKTGALILSREEERHKFFYDDLIKIYNKRDRIYINESLYLKVKNILFDFKKQIKLIDVSNINELIKFSVEFEKKNTEILKEILNVLAKIEYDYSKIEELFKMIIKEEEKHLKNLRFFISK